MADLRPAQAKDTAAVVAIDPLGGTAGRADEIQALISEQASLVAVQDGAIAGFLAVRPGHFYQRDFIDLLFVAPSVRRQGLGRALIRAALRNAATSRIFTSTNESNTPMRELLRSEGWTLSGVLDGLDEGDPEHVFFHNVDPCRQTGFRPAAMTASPRDTRPRTSPTSSTGITGGPRS